VQASDATLQDLYRETCDEYNRSPLAVAGGYYHQLNDFTLLQLKEVVKRLPPTGGVFLDIGTGSGIVPRAIRKLGARSITVDWPATGTEDAIRNARDAGVEAHYCDVASERLPLPANSVDCVLFADVIEHLLHSPKPALEEILRVLKPRGGCVASTPNALRLTVRVKVPLGYSNWPLVFDYYDAPFHGGHHHEYAIDEFREVFRRAGFIEVRYFLCETRLGHTDISGFNDIRTHSRSMAVRKGGASRALRALSYGFAFVTWVFPKLRSELVIVVTKP
jgi:ubiquinone/menaquinone biosynthesis C-methylase UbiE